MERTETLYYAYDNGGLLKTGWSEKTGNRYNLGSLGGQTLYMIAYEDMDRDEFDESGSAIVCQHIADDKQPILIAIRDEPLDVDDSGWQFLCGSGKDENKDEAKIWSLSEVEQYEPSLSKFFIQHARF